MTGLFILLGILLLLILYLAIGTAFFFRYAILRQKEEDSDKGYENEDSIWNPYRERMIQAQRWLEEHTEEHVKITSFDGLELSALYVPAQTDRPLGTLILFHGYRSLATVDFALEAEFLHGLGYRLLLPYQRSHGESRGRYIAYGALERFDVKSWAEYGAGRFGGDIFLAGISMGCASVLMAAGLGLPGNVRGIIGDCGFTSPWEIMAHVAKKQFRLPAFPLLYSLELLTRIRAGFGLREADARKALAKSRIPVLFFHGEDDDFVPVSMTRENYEACAGPKELCLIKGAKHAQSFAVDTPGCQAKIKGFLETYRS